LLSTLDNGTPLVVEGATVWTGRALLEQASTLGAEEGEIRRVCVWSASPAAILTALALAESAAAEVFLAHRSLAAGQVLEIAERYGIDALWLDGDTQLLRRPFGEGASEAGGIHLMTSGTTGLPKVARHTLATLASALRRTDNSAEARWLLTYPATSFAGMQVLLAAALGGGTLYAPPDTSPAGLVSELRTRQITHASGTPSLWRKLLLAISPQDPIGSLKHITLGGEAVDQATLDRLQQTFPQARLRHVYASTEAGVIFTVADHRAGFPSSYLRDGVGQTELRIREGILEVRTPGLMNKYVSGHASPLTEDGWLSTGDAVLELGDRIVFQGRADGRCNVGGFKVFPDQVEAAVLAVEGVADARVYAEKGPLAGDVLVAEVVVHPDQNPAEVRPRLLGHLRRTLPGFAVPRILRFIEAVTLSASQKKVRTHDTTNPATCRP